jgi:putative flippase GtrA
MLRRVSNFLFHFGSMHRWALVGTITFLIDYVLFLAIYSANNSAYTANFFSGLVSIFFNYMAHYFWSFKSESDHSKSGIKYMINLILFWVFGTFLLKFLISSGIEAKYAKLMPVPIIAPLSFISLRFFVFKSIINK